MQLQLQNRGTFRKRCKTTQSQKRFGVSRARATAKRKHHARGTAATRASRARLARANARATLQR
eukprot:9276253-Lingulodinium_polyedra.AAC.1